jgi:hypothetical protein
MQALAPSLLTGKSSLIYQSRTKVEALFWPALWSNSLLLPAAPTSLLFIFDTQEHSGRQAKHVLAYQFYQRKLFNCQVLQSPHA